MTFADPESNIQQFGLTPGMHVADLGAGSGFYTIAAAKKVGDTGKVYALEVQKDLLEKIKSEAEKAHLHNIEVIWSNIEKRGGTKLRERSIDAAIVSNVLFQVEDKEGFMSEITRIMKPGGRVLLIDWSESFGGMGPRASDVMTRDRARTLFEASGFIFDMDISTGVHHYGIIFKKQ